MSDLFSAVDLPRCPRSGHEPKPYKDALPDGTPWYRRACPVCHVGCGASTQESADKAWRTLCERWGK